MYHFSGHINCGDIPWNLGHWWKGWEIPQLNRGLVRWDNHRIKCWDFFPARLITEGAPVHGEKNQTIPGVTIDP